MQIKFDDRKLTRYIYEVRLLGTRDMVDVVRESLNATALIDKRKFIPKEAGEVFTVRRKNFFTAMTRVEYSRRGQSSKLDGLYSEVGFIRGKEGLTSNYNPTGNLEAQEHGGTLDRPITPLNRARIGKSYNRLVSKTSMFDNPTTMITQSKIKGKTVKQRMFLAIKQANDEGQRHIIMDEYKAVYQMKNGRAIRVFGYDKNNKNKIKATHFNENAALDAQKTMPKNFIQEAQKKIKYRASKI